MLYQVQLRHDHMWKENSMPLVEPKTTIFWLKTHVTIIFPSFYPWFKLGDVFI
jgi:hypothetical protein